MAGGTVRWMFDGVPGAFGLIALLFLVAFTVALIVGIVLLVRAVAGSGSSAGGASGGGATPALRILEERYARGEIDRDEFLQRRADLRG